VSAGWRAEDGAFLLEEGGVFYLLDGVGGAIRDRWVGGLSSAQEWLYKQAYAVEDGALVERLDAEGDGEPEPTKITIHLRGLVSLGEAELAPHRAALRRLLEREEEAAAVARAASDREEARYTARFFAALDAFCVGDGDVKLTLEPEYADGSVSPEWIVRCAGVTIFRAGDGFGRDVLHHLTRLARERLGKRLGSFDPVLRTPRDDWNYYTD
jgi:hypothetical protein